MREFVIVPFRWCPAGRDNDLGRLERCLYPFG
jgi:hypothetical protein